MTLTLGTASAAQVDAAVGAWNESCLARYERQQEEADAYWSWREQALDRGGWCLSENDYVAWLESLPAVDA